MLRIVLQDWLTGLNFAVETHALSLLLKRSSMRNISLLKDIVKYTLNVQYLGNVWVNLCIYLFRE